MELFVNLSEFWWVKTKSNKDIEEWYAKRRKLKGDRHGSNTLLSEVEEGLAHKCAEENYWKIKEEISGIECEGDWKRN